MMAALGLATEDDDGASAPKRDLPKAKARQTKDYVRNAIEQAEYESKRDLPKAKAPIAPAKATFRSADKMDGLSNDERNILLQTVAKARQTNDITKDYVRNALEQADVELLSDMSDNDLEKLRRALNDIILATTED